VTTRIARFENGTYSNPNVITGQDAAFGVLKLSLHPDSYSWDYRPALTGPGLDPATAMSYSDSGSAPCRG
jgi:acid phosphatase type 7